MKLADILPAITKINSSPKLSDPRAITYLATYPSILKFSAAPGSITVDRFNQLAVLAYGWMPRVVRINPGYVAKAISALNVAVAAKAIGDLSATSLQDIEHCLNSVVGASKILHFVNNEIFPIWDSNVEGFRMSRSASTYHMRCVTNYFSYACEVHSIRSEPGFNTFFANFSVAMNSRLATLGITAYKISEVRAIEAAAFELA